MNEKKCKAILKNHQDDGGNTVSLLQEIQEEFGYIPEDVVFWFAEKMNIPASSFYGVATFYSQFHLKPRGKNILTACCGTACHVKGSDAVISKVRTELNLQEGENTTEDLKFTLESVACVGACSIAPVLIANKKVYGKVNPEDASKMLKELK